MHACYHVIMDRCMQSYRLASWHLAGGGGRVALRALLLLHFTVEEAYYKDAPTWTDPHRVVLRVAPDNQLERTDVPNAPWG